MSLTLGLTGMDPATEAALKATFLEANARLGGRWSLVSDAEAGHVVVDMDSMYGPMSWLRLHAAGRQVVGLTSAPRTQTDYRLGRPFDTAQLVSLLADIAQGEGVDLPVGEVEPDDVGAAFAAGDAADAQPRGESVALQRQSEPAEHEPPPGHGEEDRAPDQAAPEATADQPAPEATEDQATPGATPDHAMPQAAADAAGSTSPVGVDATADPEPSAPAERTLATWLVRGALQGPVRYRRSSGPTLLIDPGSDSWHGPTPLKPIAPYFEGGIDAADLEPLDTADWARESASSGPAQPLSRLRWLGGLVAGGGQLQPGLDPETRFQLVKWPQTEREYPRHFRIATQMMRGPATVAEIATASGVPAPDVADFVNANLATGFAEPVTEAAIVPEEPARARGGLLGRLRSR